MSKVLERENIGREHALAFASEGAKVVVSDVQTAQTPCGKSPNKAARR